MRFLEFFAGHGEITLQAGRSGTWFPMQPFKNCLRGRLASAGPAAGGHSAAAALTAGPCRPGAAVRAVAVVSHATDQRPGGREVLQQGLIGALSRRRRRVARRSQFATRLALGGADDTALRRAAVAKVHVGVRARHHLLVELGARVAVEVLDEPVRDVRALLPEERDGHDWEPVDQVLDIHVHALLVLNAGRDGALRVVERAAGLHAELGQNGLGHVPDGGRQGVAPDEEAPRLQDADDLLEDGALLGADGRLCDVRLRDDDDVDGAVWHRGLPATAAPHTSGHPLALEPRVVLGVQHVASVDRCPLHVEGRVAATRNQLGDVVRAGTRAAADLHDLRVGVRLQVPPDLLELDQTLVGRFAMPLRLGLAQDPIDVRDAPSVEGELIVRAGRGGGLAHRLVEAVEDRVDGVLRVVFLVDVAVLHEVVRVTHLVRLEVDLCLKRPRKGRKTECSRGHLELPRAERLLTGKAAQHIAPPLDGPMAATSQTHDEEGHGDELVLPHVFGFPLHLARNWYPTQCLESFAS
mmetsp:Transcript_36776/g.83195  ORF Transcript_36776/g.83195 Transcript_36776/m.83195 type:complete len:524 (-) Transcript_36776:25-1596(-)